MLHTERVLGLVAEMPRSERAALFDCAHAQGRSVSLRPGSRAETLWRQFEHLGWAEPVAMVEAEEQGAERRARVYRVTALGARAIAVLAARFDESRATGHPF